MLNDIGAFGSSTTLIVTISPFRTEKVKKSLSIAGEIVAATGVSQGRENVSPCTPSAKLNVAIDTNKPRTVNFASGGCELLPE